MAEAEKPDEGVVEGDEGGEAKVSFFAKLLKPPLLFIVIGVLVVVLGGAGFILFSGKKKPKSKPAAEAKTEEVTEEKKEKHGEATEEKKEEGGEEKKEEKKEGEGEEHAAVGEGGEGGEAMMATFKLEPMVVNIPDKNTIHYLKFQLEVAVSSPEVVEEMKAKMSQLKDALLFIASDKSLREIMTAGGKNLLKEDIQDSFNKLLKKGKVKELYFTEFTIQ